MITWLLMNIKEVVGANYPLVIVGFSWALFALLFFVVKPNRGFSQIKWAGICGAIVTFVCDIIWFFTFFDNFDYINPGLKGMLWFAVLPGAMLVLVMILTYINTNHYHHNEIKRQKEEKKLRKKESRRAKYENSESEGREEK